MTVLSRYCCGVRMLNANFEAMETSKSDTVRWPFTASSAASIAPTSRVERYASLDVLRGAALLGILIMNIQGFAMVSAAYVNPSVHMDLSGLNWWIWSLSHAFADMKFMALFSILFGAGIVLGTARRDRIGQPSFSFFYRRYAWLFLFGLIHAYFLWHGDILVTYAICAFAVYWLRGLSVIWLLVASALMLGVGAGLLGFGTRLMQPADLKLLLHSFAPSQAELDAEIAAFRGSWLEAMQYRVAYSWETQSNIPFWLFWRAGGLMLWGMALFKLGVLSAARSRRFYSYMLLGGLMVGLPLVLASVVQLTALEWDAASAQVSPIQLLNYFGSLGMAMAYLAGIMLVMLSGYGQWLKTRLIAVGRIAFTNYILQSVVCTLIFYGVGLGLFGSLERWMQAMVVAGIWIAHLILSPLWLRYFHFGPLEWLWRSLSYLRLQPIRMS